MALPMLIAAWGFATRTPALNRLGSYTLPDLGAAPLAYSPDGRTLLVGGRLNPLVIYDTKAKAVRASLDLRDDARRCVFSPDSRQFAYVGWKAVAWPSAGSARKVVEYDSNDVTVRDTADGRVVATLPNSGGSIPLQFARDGRTLVAFIPGPDDGVTVRTWDTAGWAERSKVVLPGVKFNGVPAITPDGRSVALVDQALASVVLRDVTTGRVLKTLHAPDRGSVPVSALRWLAASPDGTALAASREDGSVLVWNLATGRLVSTLREAPPGAAQLNGLTFGPDGRTLVARYDFRSGGPTGPLLPFGLAFALGFGRPEANRRSLVVWDVASGRRRGRLAGLDAEVTSFAVTPDGRSLATDERSRNILLWDLGKGR